jgi:peptidyl-prolyl isomerase H (cyclophilin H)
VVFGKVIEDGLRVVRMIENVSTIGSNNKPKLPIAITQCGQY